MDPVRRFMVLGGGIAVLTGCAASLGPEAARIVEAHPSGVTNCEPAGAVYGGASGFHWSESEAMTSARNKALESAAKRDATHVVWQHDEASITPEVSGTAYRCPR